MSGLAEGAGGGRTGNTGSGRAGGSASGGGKRRGGGGKGGGRRSGPKPAPAPAGVAARRLAIDALVRIDDEGAYANLLLPELLERSTLASADRGFVTELVYGTTRMRRACDHLVDRFLLGEAEPRVRAALRLGAYQLAFLGTPPHAAVDATVSALGGRARGLANAVLRKVAGAEVAFPDEATRLSYPDWIVTRLAADLGPERATASLEAMNRAAEVVVRDDGYVQDPASQLVVEAMDVEPGERVADLCAAPGGKATALAACGAVVVAADSRALRARLMAGNVARLGATVPVVVADGTAPPIRPGSLDRVLVDAPCSGLGSLRRRPDARWRIDADAPERLHDLQVALVRSALGLVRPGGVVTYSVCTLTTIESDGVLAAVTADPRVGDGDGSTTPVVEVLDAPGAPWEADGPVAGLLPTETDGMRLFRLRRRS
ncbi:MAG: transcription antitermination factor NusB [Actinomycetota bacterium]